MASTSGAPLLPEDPSSSSCGVAPRTIRKLDWRVLLPCAVVVFLSYVDRSNIGYAAQDLCNDLKLDHEEYGVGVSLFYVGYLLTQVLGNVLLRRFGPPVWMAFLMFAWGCVATSFGFIQNTTHFYVLRVLLGFAEGGTFPAIWNYLSLFYPEDHITGAYTVIIAAISFSMPISAPISAGLLTLGEALDMQGWRLLFIVEGLMPVVLSLYLYFYLPASPRCAVFLNREEKMWISSELKELHDAPSITLIGELKIVLSTIPWWIGSVSLVLIFGICNILMSWATLIIHDMLYGENDDEDSKTCGSTSGASALPILLTAIPYLFSGTLCLSMKYVKLRNRSRFASPVLTLAGSALIAWAAAEGISVALGFILLTCSIGSGYTTVGPITGLSLSFFDTSAHATASAMYNMVASLGGVIFPPIIGRLIDVYGYGLAVSVSGGFLLLAAILILFVKDPLSWEDTKEGTDTNNQTCVTA